MLSHHLYYIRKGFERIRKDKATFRMALFGLSGINGQNLLTNFCGSILKSEKYRINHKVTFTISPPPAAAPKPHCDT
jgi:hypothetical protein